MRFHALLVLVFVLFAGGLPAQERTVCVKTEDGRELHGVLVRVSREKLVLRTGKGVVSLDLDQVVSYDDEVASPPPAKEDPAEDSAGQESDPAQEPEAAGNPEVRAKVQGSHPLEPVDADPAIKGPRGGLGYLPERLSWLGDRYLWLVPAGGPQVVSTVLLTIFLLGLCMQLGARVAAVEDRSFVRALVASTVVVVVGGAEVAAMPFHWIAVVVAVGVNFVAWGLLMASLFGVRFFQGMTVLFTVGFCALIAFLVLEVVDYSLQVSQGIEA